MSDRESRNIVLVGRGKYCANGACRRELEPGDSASIRKDGRLECRGCFPFSPTEMRQGKTLDPGRELTEAFQTQRVRVMEERRILKAAMAGDHLSASAVFDIMDEKLRSEEAALGL